MGQQALIAGRLGELPLQQADHKDGIGLGQAHTARRCHDHAVKALGDMPHVGRAQQQRKKLGVLGRGQLFTAQQTGKLVKQPHNDIPFAQDLIRLGQAALCAQLLCKALKRLLSPEGLQKQEDLFGQCRCGGTGRLWHKVRQPLHKEGAGAFGIGQHLPVLIGVMAVIPRRAAGKGLPPIGGGQLPCVGVVFKGALLAFRQIDQPGLEQVQHAAARHAAQKLQRGMDRPRRGGVFGGSGLIAEKRDALQTKLIPQRGKVLLGIAADDRHAAVGGALPRAGRDLGGHRLGLGLTGFGRVVGNGRMHRVYHGLRRIGRVRQQQAQLGQRRCIGMAAVLGQQLGMGGHTGLCGHPLEGIDHIFGTAEQPHAAVPVLLAVTAKADRYIGHRQHGRQQGALRRIKGIKLVNVHGTPRKEGCVKPLRRALLAVAGVHSALGQQPLIRSIDQGQFIQLFAVGSGGLCILCQHFRRYTGAFQFADGLGRLLAEGGAAPLAAVVHDLVQQRIRRPAQQQGTARLGQGGHGRPAVAAQQGLRQRGEGVAFDIGGKAVPQRAVELPLGGGGKLLRHDKDAALPPRRACAQGGQHGMRFARTGGAQDEV